MLSGAASALSVAGDVSPQVVTAMRGLNAVQAGVGTILQTTTIRPFPAFPSAVQGTTSALEDVRSTATGSFGTGGLDGALSNTPHLMTPATEAGRTFHSNLSTAAFDTLRRVTDYRGPPKNRKRCRQSAQLDTPPESWSEEQNLQGHSPERHADSQFTCGL
ncbi:hypothetical protein [Burkholderia sp. Nafp2/4-1b]|uniref:hypothetical protein n=1 Tax=Burkholderia sp. Nafp2/4-1b TaxID=2116686 RepID=UPI0013CF3776|nr:hypothetical protein [Burkholderia sp. Nafp2/4-1b]